MGKASPTSDNIRLFFFYLPQERRWLQMESITTVESRRVSKEHRTWKAQSSGSHAFSFFGILSATLLCPQAIILCQEQIYKAAKLPNYQKQRCQNVHVLFKINVLIKQL